MELIFLAFFILLALGIVGRWMAGRFGCCCHICGRRMLPFHKLSAEDQGDILGYFRGFEDREPDTEGIFICDHCCIVYDDFSGERRSMEGDDRSICKVCNTPGVWYMGTQVNTEDIQGFRDENRALVDRIECLQCKRNPSGIWDCMACDTKMKVTGCRKCYTLYAWMSVHGSRYKFHVPLSDKETLKQAMDSRWGLFEA